MTVMNSIQKQKVLVLLVVAMLVAFSSCRTGRDLPARRLKPMSAEKLLNRADENAFDFNNLTIRRINVQFSDGDTRTSFRANLKAAKNEKILASIFKLNIPMGRILLTPENVTFVNYIDKNYFEGDYSYISNFLDFNLNFITIQSVISNPINAGIIEPGTVNQRFQTSVEDGMYVLQSRNSSNEAISEQRRYFIRNNKSRTAPIGGELGVSKLMLNPQSFVIEKLIMTDTSDDRRLEVDFSEFEKVEGYNYPGKIDVKMFSGNELTELNIKFRGLSAEKVKDLELNIPDNYQRIRPR